MNSYKNLFVNLRRHKKLPFELDLQLKPPNYIPGRDKSEEEILLQMSGVIEHYQESNNQNGTKMTIEYNAKSFPGLELFTLNPAKFFFSSIDQKSLVNLVDQGPRFILKIPLKKSLVQGVVFFFEGGRKKARLVSSSYIKLKI